MAASVFGAPKLTTQKGSEGGPGAPLSRFLNGQSMDNRWSLKFIYGHSSGSARPTRSSRPNAFMIAAMSSVLASARTRTCGRSGA